jgi:hypothetical protein
MLGPENHYAQIAYSRIINQGCGSAFISSESGILGRIPIRSRIQGFIDQKLGKKLLLKKN